MDPMPSRLQVPLFSPSEERAKLSRNKAWQRTPLVPTWVNSAEVGLDRFFTRPDIARTCYENLLAVIKKDHAHLSAYQFVDPGAGTGAFFDLLPKDRRIGIDIMPTRAEFIEHDYLTWEPPTGRYVVVGNPPFGYRAWLALAFVNRSASFADYMGFILPMAFQSDGKGSPKYRVEGAELVQSQSLPTNIFTDTNGQAVKINALWQVWKRGVNNRVPAQTCDDWIDLFTVDMRKERLCGQERLSEADWFLQRTFYSEPPSLVKDFSEVRYVCGYGIVIKKAAREITHLLNNTNWRIYSNLAAHNCRHISMYHIRQAVIAGGFVDD